MDVGAIVFAAVLVILGGGAGWVFLGPQRWRTLIEYQRIIVFSKSGRFDGVKGPGIVYLPPWMTSPESAFDLRDQVVRLDNEHCITSDSSVVGIEPVVVSPLT